MIKWLESSGALPPNPLLYLSYRAKRSISNKNKPFFLWKNSKPLLEIKDFGPPTIYREDKELKIK